MAARLGRWSIGMAVCPTAAAGGGGGVGGGCLAVAADFFAVFGVPPAPVSKRPPPARRGTMESILALVPSSMMGKRSVR